MINGMLWILRTGAPWRDLPARYGPWRSVASRFYRWQKAGVWEKVLEQLQEQAHREGDLDWDKHAVDGTVVRAHQHAAGAKKSPPMSPPRSGHRRRRSVTAKEASRPKCICEARVKGGL